VGVPVNPNRDTTVCDRCGVFVGHQPQVTQIQTRMRRLRYRTCVRCANELDERLEDTVDEWLVLEQLRPVR
jgi:hypothetical protein